MELDKVILNVHSLLLDYLPARSTQTPSGWRTLNCPMCSDTRRRGGVKTDGSRISYNCFNCEFKTSWSPQVGLSKKFRDLAARLGCPDSEIQQATLALMRHSAELRRLDPHGRDLGHHKFTVYDRPDNAVDVMSLPDHDPVRMYAAQRGVLGLTELWKLDNTLMRDRLTVPFWHNGELVGYSGRLVKDSPNKRTPKYLNNQSPGYVYNLDAFGQGDRKYIIVVEGVFDAILLDGVSVLSNRVSDQQASQINHTGCEVIVCPDRDQAGDALIQDALKHGWAVSFPPWQPGIKDAADAVDKYGRAATLNSIIHHSEYNKLKIELRRKID